MKNKTILIRSITRAAAFLIPLTTLCIALFTLEKIQDTTVGAIITLATAASVFYFKKSEEPDKESSEDPDKNHENTK